MKAMALAGLTTKLMNDDLIAKGASMSGIIGYLRVSTRSQGDSGLGLDGQKVAIATYAKSVGESILASYVEVESGKRSDRPQLAKCLAHAKRSKATVVFSKWDRLSRNLAFLSALMDSGVEFKATDNPHANRLTIHILAAVAEAEARAISERTKAALTAAKARGTKLGSARPEHWNGREDRRQLGIKKAMKVSIEIRRKAKLEAYADLLPIVTSWREQGSTLQAIADKLNRDGHTTRKGKPWQPKQVARVLAMSASQTA